MCMGSKTPLWVLLGPLLIPAVTDGPVGQRIEIMTGLITDLGGPGFCGKAAALSGLFGDNQPA